MDTIKLSALAIKDLDRFTNEEKMQYYNELCEALHLDPWKRPFEYFHVDRDGVSRLIIYITKAGGNQLRDVYDISIEPVQTKIESGIAIVTAVAKTKEGRTDSDAGAISIVGLSGKDLANAIMSATTKAKRRVTISILGLGFLDESEVQDLTGAVEKVVQAPDLKEASYPTMTEIAKEIIDPKVLECAEKLTNNIIDSTNADVKAQTGQILFARKPTNEELAGFRKRFEKYSIDLQMAGVQSKEGRPAATRIKEWFKAKAGDGLMYDGWKSTLERMDTFVEKFGIQKLAEKIIKETT